MAPPERRHRFLETVRARRVRHLERSRIYRTVFAASGFTVLSVGIALLVLPGPGLLVIAVGLAMLALEFAWAERMLERTLDRMDQAGRAVSQARRAVKLFSTAAGLLAVAALVLASMYWDFPLLPF